MKAPVAFTHRHAAVRPARSALVMKAGQPTYSKADSPQRHRDTEQEADRASREALALTSLCLCASVVNLPCWPTATTGDRYHETTPDRPIDRPAGTETTSTQEE